MDKTNNTIYQLLLNIQEEINVPKDQYNQFGGFKYRNAETILAAVKPTLKKYRCVLYMSDSMVQIGDKNYLQSTAKLIAVDLPAGENQVEASALAREADARKGMDDSQITGATSSYARKYALCGLFAIDDGVDNDTLKPEDTASSKPKQPTESEPVHKLDFAEIRAKVKEITTVEDLAEYWRSLGKMTEKQAKFLQQPFAKRKKEILDEQQ